MIGTKWLALSEIQAGLNASEHEALSQALQRRELPLVKFGNEYLLDDEDYRAWREKSA